MLTTGPTLATFASMWELLQRKPRRLQKPFAHTRSEWKIGSLCSSKVCETQTDVNNNRTYKYKAAHGGKETDPLVHSFNLEDGMVPMTFELMVVVVWTCRV